MGKAAGNATRAAILAGYSIKRAAVTGSEFVRKRNIAAAIAERQKADPAVSGRRELQEFWTDTLKATAEAMRDRLKASELLGKSQALFVDRIAATDKKTLEQILGESRRPDA